VSGIDYGIVVGFLIGLALAGLWISRLIRDSDDFFVAGRELTPFILGATITATNLSMLHFVGMGGVAYKSGFSIAWQNWTGSIALVVSGILVVPLMRRMRIRSVPELLELRYTRSLRTLVGAIWGLRLCIYLGLLLYVAVTAAIIITGTAPTPLNYALWLMGFALVSVLYSAIGGAWAVAIMDSVQFLMMLGGALVVLPIAVHAAGGMGAVFENLHTTGRDSHMALIPVNGDFNWLFITSIMLLGFKWATVDQSILQRAFGAQSPRAGAQGMVLSAIVTVPITMFWVLPGMAASKLHPGFDNPDYAIPWLLATTLPAVGRGLLGFVLCGLVAAQVSTITADVNSVATLFTSDVYRTLKRREPTQRELLFVVRVSSLVCGALMMAVAYWLRGVGAGAVKVNLSVVGIVDMPLFVVTILYGLMWRRTNWQGAVAGFVVAVAVGLLTYFLAPAGHVDLLRNLVPLISFAVAAVVTPIVSLMTPPPTRGIHNEGEEVISPEGVVHEPHDDFHVIPKTLPGRIGIAMVAIGVLAFFAGVLATPLHISGTTPAAVAGMILVLLGGLIRAYSH
jgi:SSS family solute:Na+ symporter